MWFLIQISVGRPCRPPPGYPIGIYDRISVEARVIASCLPPPLSFVPAGARARLGEGKIGQIAVSPDGEDLAVGSGVGVYLYKADTFQERKLSLTEGDVWGVAFGPDGTTVASGLSDGTVVL